jgi:tripartite-type tricarboxylate transporter receptor subunit TctC
MIAFKPLSVALGLALAAAMPAAAEYPEKPVEFIVPWSPGGGSDTLMRIVAGNIEPYLGVEMPIINMPGVGGTVGLLEASRRDADGYTISQVHEGLLTAGVAGVTDLVWSDFDLIALLTSSPQYLVANASAPFDTFEEFLTYAQENPGSMTMGVTLGGVPHLHAAMIADAFDLSYRFVGYEGTGERVRALVGGNLDLAISDLASVEQFVANGDLKLLALGTLERSDQSPDVPTFAEFGAPLELTTTRGIVMPKGAPQEAKDTLEAALMELSKDAAYIEQINNAGSDVAFRGQADYVAYLGNLSETVERLAEVLAP